VEEEEEEEERSLIVDLKRHTWKPQKKTRGH